LSTLTVGCTISSGNGWSLKHRSTMKTGWTTSSPVDATTFCREQRSILALHWWTNLLYWCFNDLEANKNVEWISGLGSTVIDRCLARLEDDIERITIL
jgi:hypothetical protein